jgi:hypothetical protein
MWAEGKRRKDFPTPLAQVGGSNIWAWSDVYAWASEHFQSTILDYCPISIEYAQFINGGLVNSRDSNESEIELLKALGYNPALATKLNIEHRLPARSVSLKAEPKRFVS